MTIFQNEHIIGRFMSIYDETEERGKFHVCRYLYSDDDYVLFQSISTRGFDNGFYLIPVDCIYRVDVDDEYTKRIENLFQLQNQHISGGIDWGKEPLLIQLLKHSNNCNLIISIFLEDGEYITGKVMNLDVENKHLHVEKITESGKKDGAAFINIECIERIICDSGEERCIEMLMDM